MHLIRHLSYTALICIHCLCSHICFSCSHHKQLNGDLKGITFVVLVVHEQVAPLRSSQSELGLLLNVHEEFTILLCSTVLRMWLILLASNSAVDNQYIIFQHSDVLITFDKGSLQLAINFLYDNHFFNFSNLSIQPITEFPWVLTPHLLWQNYHENKWLLHTKKEIQVNHTFLVIGFVSSTICVQQMTIRNLTRTLTIYILQSYNSKTRTFQLPKNHFQAFLLQYYIKDAAL